MTAIAGVLHLGGAAPPADLLEAMLESLAHRADERRMAVEDRALAMGAWAAPDRRTTDLEGSLAIAVDGNVAPSGAAGATPDGADLVGQRYGTGEPGFLAGLAGHFALAVWDRGRRRLLLARDPGGARPLFTTREGELLLWASEAHVLRAVTRSSAIDETALAWHLAGTSAPDPTLTGWKGIDRLPPEHCLSAHDAGAGRLRVGRPRPYSGVLQARPEPDSPELPQRLREALQEATRRALAGEGEVAIALSGGLDSPSVAGLAGRAAPDGRGLRALSARYDRHPTVDERDRIDAVARDLPFSHTYVDGDLACPLHDYPNPEGARSEPAPVLGAASLDQIVAAAASHGATTVLTGHGSDQLFSVSPLHFFDELRQGPAVVTRDLRAYLEAGWRPHLNGGLAGRIAALRLCPSLVRLRSRWPETSLVSDELARRTGLVDGLRERLLAGARSGGRGRVLRELGEVGHQRSVEHIESLGRRAGVEVRHPFLDRDFMAFAARVPESAVHHGGLHKAILRRAMAGVVPAGVLEQPTRTSHAELWRTGVGPDGRGDVVQRLIETSVLVREGYVRRHALAEAHRSFIAGDESTLWMVAAGLSAEIWLRGQLGEPLPPPPTRRPGRADAGAATTPAR